MTKATPGPWTVGGQNGFLNQIQVEPAICAAYGAGEELAANARLIAAAPDLLAALVALFGADMEHVLLGDGKDDQIEAIAMARAALAKAGEA